MTVERARELLGDLIKDKTDEEVEAMIRRDNLLIDVFLDMFDTCGRKDPIWRTHE